MENRRKKLIAKVKIAQQQLVWMMTPTVHCLKVLLASAQPPKWMINN